MKKTKNILLIIIVGVMLLILTGCGNQDIFDTNYTFTKAITYIGNERIEIEIKQWRDYEGEQIQLISTDGTVYLVSMNNTILINEKK